MEKQPEVQEEEKHRQGPEVSPLSPAGNQLVGNEEKTTYPLADPLHHVRVLYTAFDAYPGFKGAQAHIRANLRALSALGGKATLLCLGAAGSFSDPDTGSVVHAYATGEQNMLRRSELFGSFLKDMADRMVADPPAIIHFRDIWSGMPLLSHGISKRGRLVFEVNGLPSVELPAHYTGLADNAPLLSRLRMMEDVCLARCDMVITVSRLTARYLAGRGCDEGKIFVVPNATDIAVLSVTPRTGAAAAEEIVPKGKKTILYAGTLTSWQGLHTLLDAVSHLGHRSDLSLVVVASNKKGIVRLKRRITAGGLGDRVTVLSGVNPLEMAFLYEQAYLSVAPLARGARNELQGCCPLKIVESMACGTPVVASDLPVVREMVSDGDDGMLVPPGSPRALAGALDMLMSDEMLRDRLARAARRKAREVFTASRLARRLGELYTLLLEGRKQ